MPGSMAIGYGMADGSGWADTGLSRRFLMRSGFMAAGLEVGAAFAAAFIVSGDIGADSWLARAKHQGQQRHDHNRGHAR